MGALQDKVSGSTITISTSWRLWRSTSEHSHSMFHRLVVRAQWPEQIFKSFFFFFIRQRVLANYVGGLTGNPGCSHTLHPEEILDSVNTIGVLLGQWLNMNMYSGSRISRTQGSVNWTLDKINNFTNKSKVENIWQYVLGFYFLSCLNKYLSEYML